MHLTYNEINLYLEEYYAFNAKELDEESGMYYFEARYYSDEDIVFRGRDPLFEKYPFMSPYAYCANNPIIRIDPDGRAAIMSLGGGDPISDLFKRAVNYVVNRVKQAAYDATISLTKSAIDYADRNYNPVTIYDNITNPHSDLPKWQAESLAKYSDVAVSSDDFITSIRGLSKNEAKRQESGRGAFGSQSGGPTSRYVVDPANSDRVIDMRHFLSIGDMGEAIGLGVEVMQSTRDSWRPSAFDLQDFYSNNLGQQFYDSNFYQEYKSGDVDFSQALDNFFKNRSEQ
ncbi:MAG: RHS repeat-associated core domain-containing protein [Bacteroidales bacterium]|jgi:RHS repeat-associated protein